MKKILFLHRGSPAESFAIANIREAFDQLVPHGVHCESLDPFTAATDSLFSWRFFLDRSFAKLRETLRDLLREMEPDVVVSSSPIFNQLIGETFREGRVRDFKLLSLILHFTVEKEWTDALTDRFIVIHQQAEEALRAVGIDRKKITASGFPVSLRKMSGAEHAVGPGRHRVLYLINGARKKAPKLIHRLLEHPDWNLTVRTEPGDDRTWEMAKTREAAVPDRMRVVEVATSMGSLFPAHDLVISRITAEAVHESVAAACPLIAFPFRQDEEENFSFLLQAEAACIAGRPREVVDQIESAYEEEGKLLLLRQDRLRALQRPQPALTLARLILKMAARSSVEPPVLRALPAPVLLRRPRPARSEKKLLLCDLHTHTTWSDGKLTVPELVDFYGVRKFDCICITDHLCDPHRLLGRLVNLTGLVISPDKIGDYFAEIEREKKRAWNQYEMLLMAGIEFNKDGYTAKSSAHLLGVDLRGPIDPTLDLKQLIAEIHAQGGLAIASHPHEIKSEWGKNTLYLWEHLDEFAPLIDVWEVANRDDIFNPVGLKKLPFMGNSDFHKPKHIQSWKTMLHCEKEAEAIKHCLRANRDVSLTLYRDHRFGATNQLTLPEAEVPRLVRQVG